jgi:2-polyprenyl-6-methoxyphenol hydroxylase-like FAD-dependent oxidoreductase
MAERQVVVVGASMAGLLAARVLADHADSVIVVDRDVLPAGPEARKGVPQGRHAHGLLPSGERVVADLFPGLLEDLVAAGAQRVTTTDGRWWQGGGYRIDCPDAPSATFFSRPFLEWGVRRRVEALPNVSFLRASARRLVAAGDRVVAVEIEAEDGSQSSLRADLSVDASGRGSIASRWLEELGYAAPAVDQVRIDMAYASGVFTRTPGRVPDRSWYVTIGDMPRSKRFGVAFPIEDDRWIVTVGGCHGDHPPTDADGHLAFVESLPAGDIADVVRNEERLGPLVPHRLPSNQWRHFDALDRHPAGFLALGDSICSFNPVYGQGMSSAAQQAAALAACVGRSGIGDARLWAAFYREAKKVIASPWAIAAGADFVFPETTGPKAPGTDLINRYLAKVAVASQHDVKVATALWDVQGLLAPPPSLLKPSTVVRVLRAARRGPTGAPAPVRASATPT